MGNVQTFFILGKPWNIILIGLVTNNNTLTLIFRFKLLFLNTIHHIYVIIIQLQALIFEYSETYTVILCFSKLPSFDAEANK